MQNNSTAGPATNDVAIGMLHEIGTLVRMLGQQYRGVAKELRHRLGSSGVEEYGELRAFVGGETAGHAFIVDDLQGLIGNLKQAGYKLVEDAPLPGYDRIFVDDPFGNRIELMQAKAVSPPGT